MSDQVMEQTSPPVEGDVSKPSEPELELKWNGRVQRVPQSRAIELAQMGFDYTQKMQDLARQREQVQQWVEEKQQYDAALAEVRQFLTDRQRLRQYLEQLEQVSTEDAQQAVQSGQLTPEQIQHLLAQQQAQTVQMLQAMQARMYVDQLAGNYAQEFDRTIQGLREQFPVLNAIPRADRLIKEEVAAMQPRTLEEAKQFMVEVARNMAEHARQQFGKLSAASPLKGIEPPGGAGPMPQAPPGFKGKISDPQFKELVMQDLQRILSQGKG